jgi:3-oxoacyl-[acyl-carrier protein] reductase
MLASGRDVRCGGPNCSERRPGGDGKEADIEPAPARDLEGAVAIVTGANHGIGAAVARMISRRAGSVLITFLRASSPHGAADLPSAYTADRALDGEDVARDIRAEGGRAIAVEADLVDPATVPALFDTAEQAFGPVSILVNNASGWRQDTFAPAERDAFGRRMEPLGPDTFAPQFLVDARGSALMIAELARRHRRRGADWGRIVSLTSSGDQGFPTEASYGAAKAALGSYTLTAARELSPFGITANLVHPPITDTGWVTPEVEREALEMSARGVARPDEVAEAIGLLLGRAADRVTGTTLRMT